LNKRTKHKVPSKDHILLTHIFKNGHNLQEGVKPNVYQSLLRLLKITFGHHLYHLFLVSLAKPSLPIFLSLFFKLIQIAHCMQKVNLQHIIYWC
jgi:hypothetical protein